MALGINYIAPVFHLFGLPISLDDDFAIKLFIPMYKTYLRILCIFRQQRVSSDINITRRLIGAFDTISIQYAGYAGKGMYT